MRCKEGGARDGVARRAERRIVVISRNSTRKSFYQGSWGGFVKSIWSLLFCKGYFATGLVRQQ
jgi:ribosomal protein S14